jgi:hypothetical protein
MPARDWFPVSLLLFCSAAASAQAHVEPELSRPLTPRPGFVPPGALRVADYSIVDLTPTSKFVAVSYQQSFTSPYRLAAYDYTRATNSWTARPDFSTLPVDTQEVSITPDLNTIAVYQGGVGSRVYQRPMMGAAWSGAIQIQNLNPNAYGLQFCKVRGVSSVLACVTGPNAHLELYDFDATTVSVTNLRVLTPPLGNPNNFVAFAVPLADDLGEAHGILGCIRPPVGFQQQFVFADCVGPNATWSVVFNTPTNTFFVGGDQMLGGHVIAANSGLPIGALPVGPVDVLANYTFATRVPATGGVASLVAMGAPGDLCILAVAGGLIPPTVVAGYTNELGVDPGSIVAILAATMTAGVARFSLTVAPTAPGMLPMQSLILGPPPFTSGFGSSASFVAF